MQTSAELDAPCAPEVLFRYVAALDRYPEWMSLVHAAEPLGDAGPEPAWTVELRTRVGPLARSKRLRMVRTGWIDQRLAVFERDELDGRRHSAWVLRAEVTPTEAGSCLGMHLSYGGSLWTGGVLQKVLDDEIRRGSERLLELVTAGPTH